MPPCKLKGLGEAGLLVNAPWKASTQGSKQQEEYLGEENSGTGNPKDLGARSRHRTAFKNL